MGNPNVYTCIDDFKDHLYDEIKGKEGPGGKFSNLYPIYKIWILCSMSSSIITFVRHNNVISLDHQINFTVEPFVSDVGITNLLG